MFAQLIDADFVDEKVAFKEWCTQVISEWREAIDEDATLTTYEKVVLLEDALARIAVRGGHVRHFLAKTARGIDTDPLDASATRWCAMGTCCLSLYRLLGIDTTGDRDALHILLNELNREAEVLVKAKYQVSAENVWSERYIIYLNDKGTKSLLVQSFRETIARLRQQLVQEALVATEAAQVVQDTRELVAVGAH